MNRFHDLLLKFADNAASPERSELVNRHHPSPPPARHFDALLHRRRPAMAAITHNRHRSILHAIERREERRPRRWQVNLRRSGANHRHAYEPTSRGLMPALRLLSHDRDGAAGAAFPHPSGPTCVPLSVVSSRRDAALGDARVHAQDAGLAPPESRSEEPVMPPASDLSISTGVAPAAAIFRKTRSSPCAVSPELSDGRDRDLHTRPRSRHRPSRVRRAARAASPAAQSRPSSTFGGLDSATSGDADGAITGWSAPRRPTHPLSP